MKPGLHQSFKIWRQRFQINIKEADMYHLIEEFEQNLGRNRTLSFLFSLIKIILSALLQTYVMQVFMDPCNLISGGFTGIALFISRVASLGGMNLPVSLLIILLNVPVAAFCVRAISKRFVLLSAIQFVLVSMFTEIFSFEPLFYDIMMNLLFGGILWGFSISLALSSGGSTGGTDFIAQYVSNKIHRSIFNIVFYFNVAMYIAYGFSFGWIYCAYSIIFQFLSTTVINKMYKRYQRMTLQITCKDPKPVVDAFMETVRHGMSIIECKGAYKGETYYICESVVSSFELPELTRALIKADPHCLINVYRTVSFYGSFYQKPIE